VVVRLEEVVRRELGSDATREGQEPGALGGDHLVEKRLDRRESGVARRVRFHGGQL
jgi:hypothetical protein